MTHLPEFSELLLEQLWKATWQGAILVTLALLFARAFRRLPAALHCWVWRIVCVKMLLAFVCLASIELPWLPIESQTRWPHLTKSPDAHSPAEADYLVVTDDGANTLASSLIGSAMDSRSETTIARTPNSSTGMGVLAIAVAAAWCIGVFWQIAILFSEWRKANHIVQRAKRITHPTVVGILEHLARNMKVATPQCRSCSEVRGPIVTGSLRPVIVIPAPLLMQLNTVQLRLLLTHEFAHIRRHDLMWNWIAVATRSLFFFNPLVWLVQKRWMFAQEAACDEAVLRQAPHSLREYASLLLQCSLPGSSRRQFGLASGAFSPVETLRRRIEKMNDREHTSRRALVFAVNLLAIGTVAGILPWKLVPASAKEADFDGTRPQASSTADSAVVAVVRTFEIDPSESRLAHDSLVAPPFSEAERLQFRRENRGQRRSGRLNRSGGGTRSSAEGGFRSAGLNATEAGGFAGGTSERPNYVVALQLNRLDAPSMITVAKGAIAVDDRGRKYEPLTDVGRARVSVPAFEDAHPDCAGVYFRFGKRPQALASLKGELLMAPLTVHEAIFPLEQLREGDQRDTDFGTIQIGAFDRREGWQFEVTTPGPGPDRRQVFKFLDMVRVELIDSEGQPHRPRSQQHSGGGEGGGPGIVELTRLVTFDELPEGKVADYLRVSIKETGKPRRVPFELKDIALD